MTILENIGEDIIEAELEKETEAREKFNLEVRNYILQILIPLSI